MHASNKSFALSLLVSIAGFVLPSPISAQTFATMQNLDGQHGSAPNAGLLLSGSTLFGTTQGGGAFGVGTVFALQVDGTGFTNLYNFTGGSDGAIPFAGLVLSGDTLYGTTTEGGVSNNGVVFAIHLDGTGFTNLHSFTPLNNSTNGDGAYPRAGLLLSGDMLFGSAELGGNSGVGTVFALRTDGSGFTNLHHFSAAAAPSYTNQDGAFPFAGLALSGNTLYGSTYQGGTFGGGALFALHTDGSGFTNLHEFAEGGGGWPSITNSDGFNPSGTLILISNTLFGATFTGGSGGAGVVFALGVDGTGFANLHNFTAVDFSVSVSNFTNQDGANPVNGLLLAGDTLYGATYLAGPLAAGTVFAVKTNGEDFTTVRALNGTNEGSKPLGGLALSGNVLFGTTSNGGSGVIGTIFSLTFLPQLTMTSAGANVVLNWPVNLAGLDFTGFTLQATKDLISPAWTTNLPVPTVINGLNTVTNPTSGTVQFFRLVR